MPHGNSYRPGEMQMKAEPEETPDKVLSGWIIAKLNFHLVSFLSAEAAAYQTCLLIECLV